MTIVVPVWMLWTLGIIVGLGVLGLAILGIILLSMLSGGIYK